MVSINEYSKRLNVPLIYLAVHKTNNAQVCYSALFFEVAVAWRLYVFIVKY